MYLGLMVAVAKVRDLIAETSARQVWIDSLPEAIANEIRASDTWAMREGELHRRALEIVGAGRSIGTTRLMSKRVV